MLPPGNAGSEDVDTQIVVLDLDVDVLADLGTDIQGGEGGVTAP